MEGIFKASLAVAAFIIGAGFILLALTGGLEFSEAKIPPLEIWQRLVLAALGFIFFVVAVYVEATKKVDAKGNGIVINNIGGESRRIDLNQVPVQFGIPFEIPGLAEFDLRKNTVATHIYSSSVSTFTLEMRSPEPVDYAVIDLGTGHEWLTSRLFILSILLARIRGVKALVFVDSIHVTRRFLGWADVHVVRWTLAQRFAPLETAYRLVQQSGRIASPTGRFEDTDEAVSILRLFLEGVQAAEEPKFGKDQWVHFPESGIFEYAHWLDHALVARILGDELRTRCVNPQPMKAEEQTRAVLAQDGQFIALVNDERRFERLVNRQVMVDQLTRRLFRSQDVA